MAEAKKKSAAAASRALMSDTYCWVNWKTKLSMNPSTCEDVGSRHATLCQVQSLKRRDATSMPTVARGLAARM